MVLHIVKCDQGAHFFSKWVAAPHNVCDTPYVEHREYRKYSNHVPKKKTCLFTCWAALLGPEAQLK